MPFVLPTPDRYSQQIIPNHNNYNDTNNSQN